MFFNIVLVRKSKGCNKQHYKLMPELVISKYQTLIVLIRLKHCLSYYKIGQF